LNPHYFFGKTKWNFESLKKEMIFRKGKRLFPL
jgi:hypothetical protein